MRRAGIVAPVLVGSEAPTQGPPHACVACGTTDGVRVPAVLQAGAVALCRDAGACCARYRRGVSPQTYAAALRGEILGVAP
jgi:hypothetical protein